MTTKSTFAKAKNDHLSAVATLRGFQAEQTAQRDALLEKKRGLEAEIAAITNAPLQPDDVLALWCAHIDRSARDYIDSGMFPGKQFFNASRRYCPEGIGYTRTIGDPLTLADVDAIESGDVFERRATSGHGSWRFFGKIGGIGSGELDTDSINPAMMFFFGDVMKAKLKAHFSQLFASYSENEIPGLPVAQRRVRIRELRAQIAALDTELAEVETLIEQAQV